MAKHNKGHQERSADGGGRKGKRRDSGPREHRQKYPLPAASPSGAGRDSPPAASQGWQLSCSKCGRETSDGYICTHCGTLFR
ncbi:MAG: hypothetical protein UY92_C0011G0034 [Candidatus Magasanikbacteria bacterium GW2011_GWA2_56_11]|uniref:Uncharacterized protein n=1 Tax=Candidatus Magasanikbacteria bacterium GW2011_GWA2_56_11 TaxID=1619044 RepID=A0A0G2AL57_9BACT|nr:MAG: hypothetical protein UY92_C0011G0034 [Candidatus Magasanikbacteria bacterium GW2011_GWA2_56_11]